MKGVEQPPQYHPEGDVWMHTLLMLEQLDHPTPTLAWGALLHDVGKPPTFRVADRIRFDGHVEEGVRMAHAILHRLRFSRDDMEQIEALVANHMKFKDAAEMKESTLKRFLRLPKFEEHLELHRLDCHPAIAIWKPTRWCSASWASFPEEHLKPEPLLTGDGFDRRGIYAGTAIFGDSGRGGGCPAGRRTADIRRGNAVCPRAVSGLSAGVREKAAATEPAKLYMVSSAEGPYIPGTLAPQCRKYMPSCAR